MEKLVVKDILKITLDEAIKIHATTGMTFIIRDGKLKGFSRDK